MELLTEELARLWKAVRGKPPPVVDELRLLDRGGQRVSFAAAAKGTEAEVTFADADDAAWLVDVRQPGDWTAAETLTLRGRMVEALWAMPKKRDCRALKYTAPTDASSQISYGTVGTQLSCSETVAERVAKVRPASGPAGNRAVILEGFPKDWPARHVKDEVLSLLKQLWKLDGYTFDPKSQLHHGGDGGIKVRPGRCAGEATNGTCLVRLRAHLDAKWLADGGAGDGLTVGGHRLSAAWARPRQ